MEDNVIHINPEDIEIVDSADYCDDVYDCYEIVPEVANPLLKRAKAGMKKIEKELYSTPAFIMTIRDLKSVNVRALKERNVHFGSDVVHYILLY